MIKDKIVFSIEKALDKIGLSQKEIYLEHPQEDSYGDYASNIALILGKKLKKTPLEIASKIVNSFPKLEEVKKIEVKKPGFINFWLSEEFLISSAIQITKEKDNFGKSQRGRGIRVIIEFGQPNTHKLPHIGHFRSYSLGESLARILEFNGYKVFRANYQGDVGLHVAKCLWGYLKKGYQEGKNLKEKMKNLQEAYVYGSSLYEKSKTARKEIEDLNMKIYNRDKSIVSLWERTKKWSLEYYDWLNKRLGVRFHRFYFESESAQEGKRIVLENLGRVFEKSQGAIIFPAEKYGLHNRVFVTAQGLPTYETKDLGLIFLKKKDFDYDCSLISTASEQIEYFKVVYKAAEQIAPKLARKFIHIPFGMVSLEKGKLSSRKGNIVSIEELLESVRQTLVALMKKKGYSSQGIKRVVEDLTLGASKYALLKNAPARNMIFNIEKSVAFLGNSGPYLQYTYARCKSVLRKAEENHPTRQASKQGRMKPEELSILRTLYKFPEVILGAGKNYSPNLICNYLFNLAQKYNLFYQKIPIIKARNSKLKAQRLILTKATAQILKNGLYLLGIKVLEKM